MEEFLDDEIGCLDQEQFRVAADSKTDSANCGKRYVLLRWKTEIESIPTVKLGAPWALIDLCGPWFSDFHSLKATVLPSQRSSDEVEVARLMDASTIRMSIVLRHVNLSPAGGDDTDQADPATAAEMMMDLFSASGIPSERIAANVVIAQPPNMGNAIHHFYLLGTLLKGYLSEGRPQHLECAVLLSCSKQNTSEGDVYRLGSQVQKPTLDRRETPALFLTEELFVEASNEPGLRFSRVSASGSGGTLYELSHSDGGADSASGMEPKGLAQQAAIQPSETFREERRSIDDLPESLLLAVDRRPGAWAAALGCTLLAILMFAVGVTHPFHHASKPSSTFPEAREVRPVEAPLVAPPVRPDTNVLVPTRVAPPYQAKPRASVQDKETSMHDSDQVVEKGKSHPEIAYTRAELETLLGKADRLSGNGQYEAAIRAYKIVLRNDARNGAAIQGLRRAELNRDQ